MYTACEPAMWSIISGYRHQIYLIEWQLMYIRLISYIDLPFLSVCETAHSAKDSDWLALSLMFTNWYVSLLISVVLSIYASRQCLFQRILLKYNEDQSSHFLIHVIWQSSDVIYKIQSRNSVLYTINLAGLIFLFGDRCLRTCVSLFSQTEQQTICDRVLVFCKRKSFVRCLDMHYFIHRLSRLNDTLILFSLLFFMFVIPVVAISLK